MSCVWKLVPDQGYAKAAPVQAAPPSVQSANSSIPQVAAAPPPAIAVSPEDEAHQKFITSLRPGDVLLIQTALASQGFYKSAVDGAWGPGTDAAIKAWQTKNSLPATGVLSAAEVNALTKSAQASAPQIAAVPLPSSPQLPTAQQTSNATQQQSVEDQADRERRIAERERQIAEREKQVATKRAETEQADREQQIAEKERQLAERERQIAEKRAEEEAQQKAAAQKIEKDRQLAEREKQLAEREKQIEQQERQLKLQNPPSPPTSSPTRKSEKSYTNADLEALSRRFIPNGRFEIPVAALIDHLRTDGWAPRKSVTKTNQFCGQYFVREKQGIDATYFCASGALYAISFIDVAELQQIQQAAAAAPKPLRLEWKDLEGHWVDAGSYSALCKPSQDPPFGYDLKFLAMEGKNNFGIGMSSCSVNAMKVTGSAASIDASCVAEEDRSFRAKMMMEIKEGLLKIGKSPFLPNGGVYRKCSGL